MVDVGNDNDVPKVFASHTLNVKKKAVASRSRNRMVADIPEFAVGDQLLDLSTHTTLKG